MTTADIDTREQELRAELARAEAQVDQLSRALASRDVIATAKGLIMARGPMTAEAAFDVLRQTSQRLNRPVREIAAELVRRHERRVAPPS